MKNITIFSCIIAIIAAVTIFIVHDMQCKREQVVELTETRYAMLDNERYYNTMDECVNLTGAACYMVLVEFYAPNTQE